MSVSPTGLSFGIHTASWTDVAPLRELWRAAEDLGFDAITVADHLSVAGSLRCEAMSTHAALACTTQRVRVGVAVYCTGLRHPGLIANSVAVVDQLSDGRAEIGLGAGWNRQEFEAYGVPFAPARERIRALRDATIAIRALLRGDPVGGMECLPTRQDRLPIWIGGGGEQLTLRVAAECADGWNVAYVEPSDLARKRRLLEEYCDEFGRDVADLTCGVNLLFVHERTDAGAHYADRALVGAISGSESEVADQIWRFIEAGAQRLMFTLRPPVETRMLDVLASAVHSTRACS